MKLRYRVTFELDMDAQPWGEHMSASEIMDAELEAITNESPYLTVIGKAQDRRGRAGTAPRSSDSAGNE